MDLEPRPDAGARRRPRRRAVEARSSVARHDTQSAANARNPSTRLAIEPRMLEIPPGAPDNNSTPSVVVQRGCRMRFVRWCGSQGPRATAPPALEEQGFGPRPIASAQWSLNPSAEGTLDGTRGGTLRAPTVTNDLNTPVSSTRPKQCRQRPDHRSVGVVRDTGQPVSLARLPSIFWVRGLALRCGERQSRRPALPSRPCSPAQSS